MQTIEVHQKTMLTPVPSIEPDYTRCRAVVLNGPGLCQQCSRRPVDTRQHRDGSLYRVCRQHKRARWFEPWDARYLPTSEEERLARARRAQQAMVHKLLGGDPPPRPKPVN